MDTERDSWINTRAYALWEQAGHPDGHDAVHWAQASDEWEKINQSRISPVATSGFDDGDEWED